MSLFDGTNSDIWACGGFPEESPLKDLLDRGDYTLEQLLSEDELLQELKGLHPQLVSYFSQPSVCQELLSYVTCSATSNKSNDVNHSIRFPYMACEVISCEVSGIIDTLADGYIDSTETMVLMDEASSSAVEEGGSVSDVGAGHNEYDSMASNDGSRDGNNGLEGGNVGVDIKHGRTRMLDLLFESLLLGKDQSGHLSDNSAAQINSEEDKEFLIDDRLAGYFEKVLSILIRHRPATISSYLNAHTISLIPLFFYHISSFSMMQILQRLLLPIDNPSIDFNLDNSLPSSSLSPRICNWIEHDLTLNLLLQHTVASQSNKTTSQIKSSNAMKSLDGISHCTEIIISLLQSSMSPLEKLLSPPIFSQILSPLTNIPHPYKPCESQLTHTLHILEAMLLQLGGYGMHALPSQETKLSIMPFVPRIIESLRVILTHPDAKNWNGKCQLRTVISQCGIPRLRGVRVLEALVLLGEEKIDEVIVADENGGGNIIGVACDLFWEMEWCSGLHQSVANMVVHVLEGENKRHHLQDYLINKYNLLHTFLNAFDKNEETCQRSRFRLGYMGHVIIMCQALEHVEHAKDTDAGDDMNGDKDEILECRSVAAAELDTAVDDVEKHRGNEEETIHLVQEDLVDILTAEEEDDIIVDEEDEPLALVGVTNVPKNSNCNSVPSLNNDASEENNISPDVMPSDAESDTLSLKEQLNNEHDFVSQDEVDMNCFTLIAQAIATPIPLDDDFSEIVQISQKEENNTNVDVNDTSLSIVKSTSDISLPSCTPDSKSTHPSSNLISFLQSHSLYSAWCNFLSTILAAATATQSTPLGGINSDRSGHDSINQANTFDDFDDTEHDILSAVIPGEDDGGEFDITDNELDIAASMMEGMYVGSNVEETATGSVEGNGHLMSGNYFYDDPLGRRQDDEVFGDEDEHNDKFDSDGGNDLNDGDSVKVINFYVGNFDTEEEGEKVGGRENENDEEEADVDSDEDDVVDIKGGDTEDNSWSNFADFESVNIENSGESNSETSNSMFSPAEADLLGKINGDASNKDIEDALFVADFTSFPTPGGNENEEFVNLDNKVHGKDVSDEEGDVLNQNEVQNGQALHQASVSNAEYSLDINGGPLDGTLKVKTEAVSASEVITNTEELDPFGPSGIVRTNIDELF